MSCFLEPKDGWKWIYVLQFGSNYFFLKIGRTGDMDKRLQQLRTGDAHGFVVLSKILVPAKLHSQFEHEFFHKVILFYWFLVLES